MSVYEVCNCSPEMSDSQSHVNLLCLRSGLEDQSRVMLQESLNEIPNKQKEMRLVVL